MTLTPVVPPSVHATVHACITVNGLDGVKIELPPTVDMDEVALAQALTRTGTTPSQTCLELCGDRFSVVHEVAEHKGRLTLPLANEAR